MPGLFAEPAVSTRSRLAWGTNGIIIPVTISCHDAADIKVKGHGTPRVLCEGAGFPMRQ